jgi:hypothetical protein
VQGNLFSQPRIAFAGCLGDEVRVEKKAILEKGRSGAERSKRKGFTHLKRFLSSGQNSNRHCNHLRLESKRRAGPKG